MIYTDVYVVVKIQTEVFWVVMLCSVAGEYECFGEPCCLHLQGEVNGAGKEGTDIGTVYKRQIHCDLNQPLTQVAFLSFIGPPLNHISSVLIRHGIKAVGLLPRKGVFPLAHQG
jgi:hypothetical protein